MKSATKPTLVDLIAGFKARCESRALLYHVGELTLHEAVDGLQHAAEESGFVRMIGQDAVRKTMAALSSSSEGWRAGHAETPRRR
jgi:hypothetical protein